MRRLTVSTLFEGSIKIPHLRLTGRWLEAAGFPPGSLVNVRVANGQLVITPRNEKEN
jgi:toxic protein SymE